MEPKTHSAIPTSLKVTAVGITAFLFAYTLNFVWVVFLLSSTESIGIGTSLLYAFPWIPALVVPIPLGLFVRRFHRAYGWAALIGSLALPIFIILSQTF